MMSERAPAHGGIAVHIDATTARATLKWMTATKSTSKISGLKASVTKVFTQTEVGALLEDINANLQALAEGQQAIGQKLDDVVHGQEADTRRIDRARSRSGCPTKCGQHRQMACAYPTGLDAHVLA